ncbi:hypothetical protein DSO57_1025825 [Entomophthora muscae]|uniref:Uncharacterized protein n=1 Tax=Entomophthora muscae TaxID=34485 RepID=A0ACC2UMR1_9FUNG|nr:hypothetical protein DSO57_1025825 [Entomophthora muscae]
MEAPLAAGIATLVTYSSIVVYHYAKQFFRSVVKTKETHEIAVIYRNEEPICLGALHTSGDIVAPAHCVEDIAQYHVSFVDVTDNMTEEFPKENSHEILSFEKDNPSDGFGAHVSKLKLDSDLTKQYMHYPLANQTSASEYIRLGWFSNSHNSTALICEPFSERNSIRTATMCLTNQTWAPNYKLGSIDFTFHNGRLEIYSLNAPALTSNSNLL